MLPRSVTLQKNFEQLSTFLFLSPPFFFFNPLHPHGLLGSPEEFTEGIVEPE